MMIRGDRLLRVFGGVVALVIGAIFLLPAPTYEQQMRRWKRTGAREKGGASRLGDLNDSG